MTDEAGFWLKKDEYQCCFRKTNDNCFKINFWAQAKGYSKMKREETMSGERKNSELAEELFRAFQTLGIVRFPLNAGNLADVPSTITINNNSIPIVKKTEEATLLDLRALFRVNQGSFVYAPEDEEQSFHVLDRVFHALQQEMKNNLALFPTSFYIIGKKIQPEGSEYAVFESQLRQSPDNLERTEIFNQLKKAAELIESAAEKTAEKRQTLREILKQHESSAKLLNILLSILSNTQNLEGFSSEEVSSFREDVDQFLGTVHFNKTRPEDMYRVYIDMNDTVRDKVDNYNTKNSWFNNFLAFVAQVQLSEKAREYFWEQLLSIHRGLGGILFSDPRHPPTEYPGDEGDFQ
jgi:hypothetical protein